MKVIRFLGACDYHTRHLAKKLIDGTRYVSKDDMINYFNMNIKNLNEVVDKERPIFVCIPYSANDWFYSHFKKVMRNDYPKREIIIITSYILNNKYLMDDDTIVFIDDCIYSGLKMSNMILNLDNQNKLKLNIFILAPFISKEGRMRLEMPLKNFKIIFNKEIQNIPMTNDYLKDKEIELLNSYYTNLSEGRLKSINNKFETFNNKYLIYFEDKIEDGEITIPLFYKGVVPNSYNKSLFCDDAIVIPRNLEIISLFD
jgi:hypothetical protein